MVETISTAVAQAYFGLVSPPGDAEVAALAGCGRRIGNNVELDLAAVAAHPDLGPDLAARLTQWSARCYQLAAAFTSGEALGPWVSATRCVIDARQRSKNDLVAEFDAVASLAGLGDVVYAATDADPDWGALKELADAAGVALGRDGDVITATWHADAAVWPVELGGPRHPTEFGRTITATVRHAAWRQRRVRRLASVRVEVEEAWPDVTATPRS